METKAHGTKIKKEHYASLMDHIMKIPRENIEAHAKSVIESGKFKNLARRIRWDIYLAVYANNNTLEYCNDSHIDTALRSIMKKLDMPQYAE